MTAEARVRARYMQTFLDMIERLPSAEARAIRAEIGDATWSEVRKASALSWLPIRTNLVATHAVAAHLDGKRTHEFFLEFMLSSFQTPLLNGLIKGVLRIAGKSPARYVEWVSKGFNLLFKDCGTWSVVERDEGGFATIEVVGLPNACATDRIWLGTVSSALHALFVIAGCDGAVTFREADESIGRVAFRLRWTPPPVSPPYAPR
jgi:hypothetical protein